jgi:hypothetical protein
MDLVTVLVFAPLLFLALALVWVLELETRKVKEWEYQQQLEYPPWQLESRRAQELSLYRLRLVQEQQVAQREQPRTVQE